MNLVVLIAGKAVAFFVINGITFLTLKKYFDRANAFCFGINFTFRPSVYLLELGGLREL
jgi:hypothetical protein